MTFRIKTLLVFFILTLFFTTGTSIAQSTPNPCGFSIINCGEGPKNALYNSFFSNAIIYASPGNSMPFWFAFGDSVTGIIDTTGTYNFSLSKVSGPGDIQGNSGTTTGYYSYLDNISFSEFGNYEVDVNVSGYPGSFVGKLKFIVPPEKDFCDVSNFGGCDSAGGNQILAIPEFSNVVPVDEVMPIMVGLVDSNTGLLDSTFSGTIDVDKVSGPGELYGVLSMTGGPWFSFNYLQFSEEGLYTIRFFEENIEEYKEALLDIQVIETTNGFEISPLSDLKIYPNPFDNQLIIKANPNLQGGSVQFSNSLGQSVLQKKLERSVNNIKIDTSELCLGVYFVTLFDSQFSKITTFKIVK